MLRATGVLFVVVLLLQGCVIHSGLTVEEFETPRSARGIRASITTGGSGGDSGVRIRTFDGELIEVREDGLLMSAFVPEDPSPALVTIAWTSIRSYDFGDYSVRWRAGGVPGEEAMRRLRSVSRFPPGLSESQLDALLESHGQDVLRSAEEGPPTADVADFLEQARSAARSLGTPEEASLAGYVPVGPDFPGMGAHWVNPYILMRDGTDPGRPPVLTYLTDPDGIRLTGLAYARIVRPGEKPPDFPYPGAWHDHGGTVDEELLALNPQSALDPRPDEPRLAMVHVWTDLENPDGIFSQDNWRVPFVRLGLPAPENPTPRAGKALFLASGGDEYYLDLVDTAGELDERERDGIAEVLTEHRRIVEDLLKTADEGRSDASTSRALQSGLEEVWSSLWSGIEGRVRPVTWERIRSLSL